jgi:hypothetical protein
MTTPAPSLHTNALYAHDGEGLCIAFNKFYSATCNNTYNTTGYTYIDEYIWVYPI